MTELGQFAGEVSAPPIQPTQPTQPPASPGRGWTAMLGVIAALFVVLMIATAAVVVLGGKTVTQPGTQPGTDTPQAAVQGWATAMETGDYTGADTYLSSTRRSDGTTSAELVMSVVYENTRVANVVIGSTNTNGNQATVSATVYLVQPPDGITMGAVITFRMIRESGGWKIDGLDPIL